jgi:TolB protein
MVGIAGSRFGRAARLSLVALAAFFALAAPAHAAFPGANGKLVFGGLVDPTIGYSHIYSIEPDGSGQAQVSNRPSCWSFNPSVSPDGATVVIDRSCGGGYPKLWLLNTDGSGEALSYAATGATQPAFSNDGARIVFSSGQASPEGPGLFISNRNGTGVTRLTTTATSGGSIDEDPAWSPDGSTIAFVRLYQGGPNLMAIDADGANLRLIGVGGHPSWSPDGAKIAFDYSGTGDGEVYAMNADGTDVTNLTNSPATSDHDPAWSPDGEKITFIRGSTQVDTMNADGSGQSPVVQFSSGLIYNVDWQPLPTSGYPHPQSASELDVSLVPAFRQCGTGGNPSNAAHSPPLATGSCNPPRPGSVLAAVGVTSQSSARMTIVAGDADATNGNQADVSIAGNLTDIQSTAGGDYDPNPSGADLTAVTRFRFTDRANGYGGLSATATEYDFKIPIDCSSTADPSVGSTCSTNTTANALVPGLIQEQRQTIVQAFRVRVDDSGANGIRGDSDDRIFATQGVFVP